MEGDFIVKCRECKTKFPVKSIHSWSKTKFCNICLKIKTNSNNAIKCQEYYQKNKETLKAKRKERYRKFGK